MGEWKINPYAKIRKVPDEIKTEERMKVDVMTSGGHMFLGTDPILAFMGPDTITHYRYPAETKIISKEEPCPAYGTPCEYVPLANRVAELEQEIERLREILQRVIRLIGNSEDAFYYAKSAAQEAFQQKESE